LLIYGNLNKATNSSDQPEYLFYRRIQIKTSINTQ